MRTLRLVPCEQRKCHYKLAHQYGRGSNRRAVYVCAAHRFDDPDCYGNFGRRGWSNKKATNAR